MADDIRVKESTLLRQYASRLNGFASSVRHNNATIMKTMEHERDRAESMLREYELWEQNVTREVDTLVRHYEDTIQRYRLTGINIEKLGHSDMQAKQKLGEFRQCLETQKERVHSIRMKAEALQERTKAYFGQIEQMSERGTQVLHKQADLIDQYKSTL